MHAHISKCKRIQTGAINYFRQLLVGLWQNTVMRCQKIYLSSTPIPELFGIPNSKKEDRGTTLLNRHLHKDQQFPALFVNLLTKSRQVTKPIPQSPLSFCKHMGNISNEKGITFFIISFQIGYFIIKIILKGTTS